MSLRDLIRFPQLTYTRLGKNLDDLTVASSGVLLAAGTVAIAGLLNIRLARRLRAARPEPPLPRMASAILAIAPIVVVAAQSALVESVTTYGRNRVIANSVALIAEIERCRARHGVYPVSLFSVWGDYKPSIMGVERYHYEPSGDAYNVIFKEPSLGFGTRRWGDDVDRFDLRVGSGVSSGEP